MATASQRILIAPLDWGLGHTTRCIPLIRALRKLGHTPVFAGNEIQREVIRRNLPDLELHPLDGYDVRYSRRALMLGLIRQIPALLRRIREEHAWLLDFATQQGIDGIISDNRYGLWHPEKPSVMLTHQPALISGMGSVGDAVARRLHYDFLHRFSEVWIPDLPDKNGLGGRLSHPNILPHHAKYVGWLSQFDPTPSASHGRHLLVLLSGPEPHRSLLADKIWEQVRQLKEQVVFVEGRADVQRPKAPNVQHIPLAATEELAPLIADATWVICRSGYSTLMDLACFGKQAILIPTPGQTEQEYLAKSLAAQGRYTYASQRNFNLGKALNEARHKVTNPVHPAPLNSDLLMPILRAWLHQPAAIPEENLL